MQPRWGWDIGLHRPRAASRPGLYAIATLWQNEVNAVAALRENEVNAVVALRQNEVNAIAALRQNEVNAIAALRQNEVNAIAALRQNEVNAIATLWQNEVEFPRRGSVMKPRVARNELPWDGDARMPSTPTGLHIFLHKYRIPYDERYVWD